MSDQRRDFSRRLAEAMRAKGYDPKPGVLHKLFNSHYQGRSVAFSTASKWLRGMALPEQDKLLVLAGLFDVAPQVLRFGDKSHLKLREPASAWPGAISESDRRAIDGLLALPVAQRKLVRELIDALASGKAK